MEKLIELFNEYERPQTNHIYTAYEVKENMNRLDILQEFIKWLVDNDKIKDLEEIEYIYGPELVNHQTEIIYTPYSLYNSLLMLLSISDTIIDDLISYLK